MSDNKSGIRKALENYVTKHDPARIKRKNKAPEKDVEKECLAWLRKHNFSVEVIESKGGSVFNVITVKAGYSDISGCASNGTAVYIELKAKGKRATLKDHQREFLIDKIKHNAFACCTDSEKHLEDLYMFWLSTSDRQTLLLDDLPKKKKSPVDDSELF